MQDLFINIGTSVIEVVKKMDQQDRKLLIVVDDDNNYLNLVSIGDLQRSLIKDNDFNKPIRSILRKDTLVASPDDSADKIKELLLAHRAEFMPIVDGGTLVEVIYWEDYFIDVSIPVRKKVNLPVVIMAGGKGTRLRPITNIIPKPLIPLGEKAIVELIVDRFVHLGCKQFHFSVNYLGELIENYFERIKEKSYNINFCYEDKPLGTAGSLHLLKDQISETFFISNCDILVDEDYSEILNFHKTGGFKVTAVAAVKNMKIPYGTFETTENGTLLSLVEKPQFNFLINTGLYILEPECLDLIPQNKFYHITHLMESLIEKGEKVGVFPISEGAWSDIGEWKVYQETLDKMGIKLQ